MIIISAVLLTISVCKTFAFLCDYHNNVKVMYQGDDKLYDAPSCIASRSAITQEITEAFVSGNISFLGPDSVRDMYMLKTIVITSKQLRVIDPGAFINCPVLTSITIHQSNMEDILRGIFNVVPSVKTLMIDHSDVDYIESSAFDGLINLKEVFITKGRLSYWDKDWFGNLSNLETLSFSKNKIRGLSRRAFTSLSGLKFIDFNHNEIATIHREAFHGLQLLHSLDLSFNRLHILNQNSFPSSFTIYTLHIDGNFLNFLSDDLLDKLVVRTLSYDLNPWKCLCINKIQQWLHKNNATVKSKGKCDRPEEPVCASSYNGDQKCVDTDDDLTKHFLKGLLPKCKRTKEYLQLNAAEIIMNNLSAEKIIKMLNNNSVG